MYELGVVEMFAGRTAKAFECVDEGLMVARRSKARVMEGALLTARGCLLQEIADVATALTHHAEAARIFGAFGNAHREASALYYLATTYLERDEPAEALLVLDRARSRVASVGAPRYEALIAACAATAHGLLGRLEDARRAIEHAESALALVPQEPSLAAAVAVQRFLLEVLRGSAEAERSLDEARALVDAHPNDDSHFAFRMLQRLVTGTDTTVHEALVVFVDASGFVSPGSLTKVTLPARSPLRRILEHFVTRRLETPGETVSIDEVIRAGWPDEKIGTDAALNRAYVALATLRKKGLRDVLVSADGGYLLSQSVVVRRE